MQCHGPVELMEQLARAWSVWQQAAARKRHQQWPKMCEEEIIAMRWQEEEDRLRGDELAFQLALEDFLEEQDLMQCHGPVELMEQLARAWSVWLQVKKSQKCHQELI